MLKILVLAHDVDSVRSGLEIPDSHIIDEKSIIEHMGLEIDPTEPGHGHRIVQRMAVLARAWKAKRPLVMLLDMRYHNAVEEIPHDYSCLIYDGSRKRRLAYNIGYKTDITIENIDEISRLTDILEAV